MSALSRITFALLYIPRSIHTFFNRVCSVFTTRFVVFLFFSQCIVKGGLYNLAKNTMLPLFKNGYGSNASQLQLYMVITMLPWAVKPLVGLLSDLIAIRGYHKKYWLLQAIVIGIACSALLFPSSTSVALMIACFTGIQYEIACCDLLSESKYSEIKQSNPESGTDCNVLVTGYQTVGAMVVFIFVGTMADEQMFGWLFFIVMLMCMSPLVPSILGWLPEGRVGLEDVPMVEVGSSREEDEVGPSSTTNYALSPPLFHFARDQFMKHKAAIGVIAFVGISSIVVMMVVTMANRLVGLIASVIVLSLSIAGAYMTMPRKVAHVALFQVIIYLSRPSMGGSLDFFYTADDSCVLNGPHFSYTYYITFSMLVGTVATLIGTFIYQIALSKWTFRNVLIFTPIISGVVSLSDIIILRRWNITYLHIGDKTAYILGEAIIEPVVGVLYAIPCSALLSNVVPHGMESSAFALLAGLANFSSMIAELGGAAIFDAAGVVTIPPGCNFEPLWWLILICHVGLPTACSVAASLLFIPNIGQDERWI